MIKDSNPSKLLKTLYTTGRKMSTNELSKKSGVPAKQIYSFLRKLKAFGVIRKKKINGKFTWSIADKSLAESRLINSGEMKYGS